MNESSEGARAPRPTAPPIVVTTAGYELYKAMRIDQTVDQVVADELADYDRARAHAARHGEDLDAWDLAQDDRAVWEGERLRAVIKPRAGGDPLVVRPDEAGDDDRAPAPRPLTPDQGSMEAILEMLGPRETFDRLLLAGPYQVVFDACQRLGSDAVAELRKMIVEHAGGR